MKKFKIKGLIRDLVIKKADLGIFEANSREEAIHKVRKKNPNMIITNVYEITTK